MSNASLPVVIRFHPNKHQQQVWFHLMLDVSWVFYLTCLIAMSITELRHQILSECHDWKWPLAIATWWTFVDFALAVFIEVSNAMAVDRGDQELPFMSPRFSVGYSLFLLAMWSLVLVLAMDLCNNTVIHSGVQQLHKSRAVAWLVIMVSVVCVMDIYRAFCASWLDGVKLMINICRGKQNTKQKIRVD